MVNAVANSVVPKFTVVVGIHTEQEIMQCAAKHTIRD
jgi:hypothetical protein